VPTRPSGRVGTHAPPVDGPERLLRALLLEMFYTVRSERRLVEQVDDNLPLRWFVGLEMRGSAWDAATFTKKRDHFLIEAWAERGNFRPKGGSDHEGNGEVLHTRSSCPT
jgi:transposase